MKKQNWRKILTVHMIPINVLEERLRDKQEEHVLQCIEEMIRSTSSSDEDIQKCSTEIKEIPPVLH